MSDKKPLYLTTTLPYVNAKPHIGFALEIVQADSYARYSRLMGREVFFNFGTDEHGQKVWQKAQEAGKGVQKYVDEYAEKFKLLKGALDLSYDAFVRTTDPHHVSAAQELWKLCEKDIVKKNFKGLYCVGCELFVKESDLVDGKCPDHPNTVPEEVEEENYFFKFSNYSKELLEYLKGEVILPEWRRQEAIKFVENGLEDFSISRLSSRMPWGVPVPGDEEHVMYVWFDALTNYISTLGWPENTEGDFEKFWRNGETIQFAGKDQIRFQSLMWQAMLFSAGIKNTDKVIYHGHITSGGQKMSKSIGNVVDPLEIVGKYGTDALRYYLLRHIHPFDDSDFTMEKFHEVYTANLVNGLGNLVSRVMKMSESYGVEVFVKIDEEYLLNHPHIGIKDNLELLNSFKFNECMQGIWHTIGEIDFLIQKEEPFKLIKEDEEKAKSIVSDLLTRLLYISIMLKPIMPATSKKIQDAIEANKKPDSLFPRIEA